MTPVLPLVGHPLAGGGMSSPSIFLFFYKPSLCQFAGSVADHYWNHDRLMAVFLCE